MPVQGDFPRGFETAQVALAGHGSLPLFSFILTGASLWAPSPASTQFKRQRSIEDFLIEVTNHNFAKISTHVELLIFYKGYFRS